MSSPPQPLLIWCLLRDQFAHVKPVEEAFGPEARFVYDGEWSREKLVAERPDVLLCVNDFHFDVVKCLDAARLVGIPSLVLQDGILEWRCQYENPLFGAGGGAPQHQPVMADKIACIGTQSARQLAHWGNAHKVEVTGMPRLDYLWRRPPLPPRQPVTRVLVMTAKNPGFTPGQRELTLRSLRDTKACLEREPGIQVFWRISRSLVGSLGIENQLDQVVSHELVALLDQVDAVISTPSTALLEAMLTGRPVAALDYHNVPRFVATAWTISAPEHLAPVLQELLQPPARKLAFQQDCLTDCLDHTGRAAERVANLVRMMVQHAAESRGHGTPVRLPTNLLGASQVFPSHQLAPLSALYPGQAVFQETNLETLQLRLARAENENARLQQQIADLDRQIRSPRLSSLAAQWLRAFRDRRSD